MRVREKFLFLYFFSTIFSETADETLLYVLSNECARATRRVRTTEYDEEIKSSPLTGPFSALDEVDGAAAQRGRSQHVFVREAHCRPGDAKHDERDQQ